MVHLIHHRLQHLGKILSPLCQYPSQLQSSTRFHPLPTETHQLTCTCAHTPSHQNCRRNWGHPSWHPATQNGKAMVHPTSTSKTTYPQLSFLLAPPGAAAPSPSALAAPAAANKPLLTAIAMALLPRTKTAKTASPLPPFSYPHPLILGRPPRLNRHLRIQTC